jgi:hypothetical protein
MLTSATEQNSFFVRTAQPRPGTYALLLSSATDVAGRLTVGLEVVRPRRPSRTDRESILQFGHVQHCARWQQGGRSRVVV